MNLARDLELRAAQAGDRVALHHEDGVALTFAALEGQVGAVAHALAALGVGRGDRVAVYTRNGPDIVRLLYAAWKLGAVPVTISGLYNGAELAESVGKTKPRLLVADDHDPAALADAVARTGVATVVVDGVDLPGLRPLGAGAPRNVTAVDVTAEDEACILFTGGTTGSPKAVSVTHGGVQDSLARLARVSTGREGPYPIAEGAAPNLIALPLFHSGGQHSLLFAFRVGRSVVLWDRFRVETLRALLERHRFDNLFLLPTMLFDLVHADRALDLSSVRSVLIAGQALGPHLRRRFEERYGVPIVMNYGSTETGHVAGWTSSDMRAGLWKPGSAGRVYPGVTLEIRADDGRALPVGEPGEVVVRSSMAKGYVDDAAATSELVRDGWVHSGDIGYVDQDGVLFLVGRKRDMIKCGGFQVWPEEIEEELRAHPLVADLRVVGAPDERLGEIPRAEVVRVPDPSVDDAALAAALVALARERLAHFKAPRDVVFVAEIPRSATGKVSRQTTEEAVR
ncbi:class I adenylate-forming enzyme family protein [Actinocorallia sp. A-T 12471]|uniref:class I adenylate-forming enzyme family protein n=1 Tax=Actinocorallia sp. A-T 12471 TaxID=3089813 RepID=UPI0029CE7CFF|nr:class I adenylate-forming enzyme family protein [Actinocorallia sp. A-T 12471]MDX6739437.1 class I adenylate-forming enzyme family protein [Actinocorallia sp. A-T 12471]